MLSTALRPAIQPIVIPCRIVFTLLPAAPLEASFYPARLPSALLRDRDQAFVHRVHNVVDGLEPAQERWDIRLGSPERDSTFPESCA